MRACGSVAVVPTVARYDDMLRAMAMFAAYWAAARPVQYDEPKTR